MDISILIPGIRLPLWEKLYETIDKSFSGIWEVVFVGPYNPGQVLEGLKNVPADNVRFIESYSSPLVCRQQALRAATGDFICFAADDVLFCPGALDEAFNTLKTGEYDYKKFIAGKYLENVCPERPDNPGMRQDDYWYLNHHNFLKQIMGPFNKNFFLVNTGLISRQLMLELGGWDCQFEACAMGCCDLSLRMQIYGGKGILQNNPIFHATHLPQHAGDHGPIHDAQTNHDMPLFLEIWKRPEALHRTCIELENNKYYPPRWARRFGAA